MAGILKNNTFYAIIAACLVSLFAMLVVPCFIAMGIARCRERLQNQRDALNGEGGDDDSTDYLVYGPFPYGSSIYGVEEIGESSGYRAPQNSAESLDSAIQVDIMQDDATALALSHQQLDDALTATEQAQFTDLDDLREPQYEGKGKAPMYAQIQAAFVEQQEQQLPENVQAQLPGSIQERIAEATAEVLAELPAEQTAAEEFQDAAEIVPEDDAPAENEQQLVAKKDE
ncbi:hypothetical protein ACQKWADRAFT_313088 [Trichoderma austrokoningii]